MKRRSFLQKLASTGIVLPIAMGFPRMRAFAKSPKGSPFMRLASSTNDHIMVLIRLAGGNDGLNTVVPYTNGDYYKARAQGTPDDISIAANAVTKLPGSNTLGLHPSLAPLAALYGEKKMTIVQNVGYPNQNLSHFRSTDIWLSGSDADVYDNAGWYAKYLEEKYPDYPDVLPNDPFAIEFGTYLSTTLIGDKGNMGIALADLSYIPGVPGVDPVRPTHAGDEEEYVRQIALQSNIFSNSIIAAALKQATNKVTYPDAAANPLAGALSGIAKLIAGGLGTQMYIVNVGNYDTHSGQLDQQAKLHKLFAEAVVPFQRDLEAFGLDDRVCMMTISEFGRRVESNGTGTDHGSASPLFVIGSGVLGGILGHDPDLGNLEGPGNLKMQYDFRQVYASVLGQWFGAEEDQIAPKALPRHFDQLPIFKTEGTVSVPSETLATFQLGQNYPNPAATSTRIPVDGIAAGMDARLTLYDMNGRELLARPVAPGETSVELSARSLPSGTYVYELAAGGVRRTRTMIVAH
jgi:uncharacterized protein (DUF1501 family)